ncbi:hypothetical protein AQ475_07150 [Burkholderia thailandensis]|nr:hypothetical protein AQ475_07150 [Burkholderia thailandensis]
MAGRSRKSRAAGRSHPPSRPAIFGAASSLTKRVESDACNRRGAQGNRRPTAAAIAHRSAPGETHLAAQTPRKRKAARSQPHASADSDNAARRRDHEPQ